MSETSLVITDRRGSVVGESRWDINTSPSTAPATWMVGWNAGVPGIPVTRETALTVDTLWKALLLISTAVAKCKTQVFKFDGMNKVLDKTHYAYRLLRYRPNRYQRAYDFKQQLAMHLILTGNAYAYIELDGRGRPVALYPLLPECVTMFTTPEGNYYQAHIYYTNGQSRLFYVDSSQMLHLTWMSYDGYIGAGVLCKAREVLSQVLAMQRYGSSFYKNSARPDVVIEHPLALNELARTKLAEAWKDAHAGMENGFKTVILDEGMKVSTLGGNQSDTQFVEQVQQAVRAVANFTGLPPSKLGDTSKSAYNSLEQDALAAFSDCYDGIIVNFDEGFTQSLMSTQEQESGSHEVITDTERLLVADLATRATAISKLCGPNTQTWTQDEARMFMGLNAIGGTAGELPPPQGAAPAPSDSEPTPALVDVPDDDLEDDTRHAVLSLFENRTKRAMARAVREVKKAHADKGIAGAFVVLEGEARAVVQMMEPETRAVSAMARRDVGQWLESKCFSVMYSAVSRAANMPPSEFAGEFERSGDAAILEIVSHGKDLLFQRA